MGLMSFFKRQSDAAPAAGAAPTDIDSVSQARVRARRRLIGAVVLVAAGVIGFPLLFETQPRPIPIDIPIEIPRKDGTPTLSLPQAPAAVVLDAAEASDSTKPTDKSPAAVADAAKSDKGSSGQVITEAAEDAGREVPAPKAASAAKAVVAAAASKPAAAKPPASHPSANKVADATKPNAAEAARAKALLEGKQAAQDKAKDKSKDSKDSADDKGRFVIQVGAFADSAAAHAVRLKVERLGMKTYTQVAQTPDGPRIRVRVGPFGTRGDAEKAQSKAKSAGLPASLLTL